MSSDQDPPTSPRPSKQDKGKGKAKADPKPKFPRSFRIAKPGDSDLDVVAREMHKHLDPDLLGTETMLAEELERIDLLEGEELPIPPGAEGGPDFRGRRTPLSPDHQIPQQSQPVPKIIEEGTSGTSEQSPTKKAILGRLKQSPGKITSFMSTTFHSFCSSPSSKLRRPLSQQPLTSGSRSSHTLTATVEQSPSSPSTGQFVRRRSVSDPEASEYLSQSRQVAFRSGILRPSIPVNIPLSPLKRLEVDKEHRRVELAHKALETGCIDGSSPCIEDLRRLPPWSSITLVKPSREIQPSFLEQIMSPQDPDYPTSPPPPTQAAMDRRSKHFEHAPVVHRWEVIESSQGEPILKRIRNPPPPSMFPARRSSFSINGNSPISNLPPGAAPAIDITQTGGLWEKVSLLSRPTAQETLRSVQEWGNHPEMCGAHHIHSHSLQEDVLLDRNSLPRYRARSLSDPPSRRAGSMHSAPPPGVSPFRVTATNHHEYTPSLEQDTGSSHSEDQDYQPPEYDSEQVQNSSTIGHADQEDDTSGAKPRSGLSEVMRLRGGSLHSNKREDESRNDVKGGFPSSQDIAPPTFRNYWPRGALSGERSSENCYDTLRPIPTVDNTMLKRMKEEDDQDWYCKNAQDCQSSISDIALNRSYQTRGHDGTNNESLYPPRSSNIMFLAPATSYPAIARPFARPAPTQRMPLHAHYHPSDCWVSNRPNCLVLEKHRSYQVPLEPEIEGHGPQPHLIAIPSSAPYTQLQRIDALDLAIMQKLAFAYGPTAFLVISEVDPDKYVQNASNRIKVLRWRRGVEDAVNDTEEEIKSTSQQSIGLPMPVPEYHHARHHFASSKDRNCILEEAQEYPLRLRGGKPKAGTSDIGSGVSEEQQIPELSTSPALPHQSSEDMPTTSPVVPYTGNFAPQPPHFSAFQNLPANAAGSSSSSAGNVAASVASGSGTINPRMITSQVTLAPNTPYVDPIMPPLFNAAFGKGPPVPYPHHASSAFHHSVVLAVHGFLSQNPGPILPGLKQLGTEAMRALDPAYEREAAAMRALVFARAVGRSAPTRPPVIVDPRSTAPPRVSIARAPPQSPTPRAPAPRAPAITPAPPSPQALAPQEETRLPFLDTAGWNEYLATMSSGLLAEAESSSSSRGPSNPIQVPLDIYEEWPAAFAGHNIQIIPSVSTTLPTSLEESLLAASTAVAPQPPVQGIAVSPAESSSSVGSEQYYPSLPAAGGSSVNEPQPVEPAPSRPSGLGRSAEAFTGESLIPPNMVPQPPSPDLASLSPTWRGGFLPAIPASVPSTSVGYAPPQITPEVFNPLSTAPGIFGAYDLSGNLPTNVSIRINRSRSASPLSTRPTRTLPRVSRIPSPAPPQPPQPLKPLRVRRLSGPGSMEHPSEDDKQSTAEESREVVEQPKTGPRLKIIEPTPRGSLGSNASPIDPSAGATAQTTQLGKEAVLGAAVQYLILERSREARNKRDTSVPPPQDPKGGRQLTVPDRKTLASSCRRRSSSDPSTAMAQYEARKALVAAAFPNQPIPLDQQVYLQQLAREAQASLVQARTEIALQHYSERQSAEAARMMQEINRGRSPSPGMRSYIDETGTEYIIRDPEYKSRSAPASSSAGQSSSSSTGAVGARSRGVGRGNAPLQRRLSQEVRAALIEGSNLQSGSSQDVPKGEEEERGRSRERKGKGREISEAGEQRDPKKKR
ncbi:uncharacterized protein L199_004847 [Kwoniella botswanensis]|uniref:uncharacterized protein n=1 Tax=Kwoniella botswanensis TaxID=1268659 RepID=UPI00315C58D7